MPQPTQTIVLELGYSTTIGLKRRFTTVEITDDKVVDVRNPVSDVSLSLVPRSIGATNINILTRSAR